MPTKPDDNADERLTITPEQRSVLIQAAAAKAGTLPEETVAIIVDEIVEQMLAQTFYREYRIRWPRNDQLQPVYGMSIEKGVTFRDDLPALRVIVDSAREYGEFGLLEGRTAATTEWRAV